MNGKCQFEITETRRRKNGGGTWMRFGKIAALLFLTSAIVGCGGSGTAQTVTLTPANAFVVRTGTQQFNATVAGISDTLVTWEVCNPAPASIATGLSTVANLVTPTGCVEGGNTTLGSITVNGLYTGPAKLPPNSMVSIVAVSQGNTNVFAVVDVTIESGVSVAVTPASVTVGTLEQFEFDTVVTGNTNTAVSWSVNGIANGNSTVGTITSTACTATMPITPTSSNPLPPGTSFGCYVAPPTAQTSVKITATAAADTTQTASATVNVITATDPTFSTNIPLEPTTAVEGSAEQDVYLFGTNFFSTSQALVNSAPVPTTFINSGMIRATIPASFFSTAVSSLPISVERQNGDVIQPVTLTVQPTRPAVTAENPVSFPSSTSAPSATLNLNGGYFSASTVANSGATSLPVTLVNSRQLQITLPSTLFATPGLVPIMVQNSDMPGVFSSTNVAISPAATNLPSSVSSTVQVGTQPVAVGIDSALGVAAVVNQGSANVSLLNLDANPISVSTVSVGHTPTSVGVDDMLHLAAVVNSTDNTLSIINLTSGSVSSTVSLPANPTGTTPAPVPYAVGVNSLTHRAIVAYSSSNIATIFDLSTTPPSLVCTVGGSNPTMPNNCAVNANSNTPPVSTGPTPAIAVEPQLNWAIVTPGGSGSVSIVDLGSDATSNQVARVPNVLAFLNISTNIDSVAINTETEQAVLVDPNTTTMNTFSLLDQTVNSVATTQGYVGVAVNPLTNIAVAVNGPAGLASVFDLNALTQIGPNITVGASPDAVAIDAGQNIALIANAGTTPGSVSILSLGSILSPQVTEVSPAYTYAAPSASGTLTVTVNGYGFSSGAQVRLDGTAASSTTVSSDGRQAIATFPASMFSSPRRYTLDVANSATATSNVSRFFVVGTVPIGLNPMSVAVDSYLNEALVTTQGPTMSPSGICVGPGTVAVVNLATASVSNTLNVGTCPEGVAVLPRLGLGVVANNGSSDATVVDYVNGLVDSTVSLQPALNPAGAAIQPDTALSIVSDSNINSNSISSFTLSSSSSTTATSATVDQGPFGLAVDPIDDVGIVTASAQNTVDGLLLTPSGTSFPSANRVSGFNNPLDATFDPITDTFLVADSLDNQIGIIDAKTLVVNRFKVGIDPTAIAYNFQSGTGVTVNQATNTLSIFNFVATNPPSAQLLINTAQTEVVLPFGGSAAFSVAINPETDIATVVDQANGRLLLIPLP
jgi:DNA-binding beta-propeller fold protein YncE